MLLCHEIDLLFILSGPRIQVLILTNLPTYSQGNRGLPVIIREIWKLGKWENGKIGKMEMVANMEELDTVFSAIVTPQHCKERICFHVDFMFFSD